MVKGTTSMGRHSGPATHSICRRCGHHSFFKRKGVCASCGFGQTKRLRRYKWENRIRAAHGQKSRNVRKENSIKRQQRH